MSRMGSSDDWGDPRDGNGPRSGRGDPYGYDGGYDEGYDEGDYGSGGGGRRRDDDRGRVRLNSNQITQALRDAQQAQQDGQLDDAIQICEELLEGGVERADVRYFLGWLYQEADRWDEAAAQFELLLNDPDYSLSCYYALGQCARAQGNLEDAAHYFDEAVDRVNLDALTREESDQLLQLCQEAAEAHREMNDLEGAETIYSALLGFLRSQSWPDQVAEVERLMRETLGTEPPQPRRRARGTASRPAGGNIPQRGASRRPAPEQQPPSPLPAPAQASSARMPAALPPQPEPVPPPQPLGMGYSGPLPAAPVGPDVISSPAFVSGAMSGSFGAVSPGGPLPGMGALAGAAAYYSGSAPLAQPGDQLAQLIHNLGAGMNGVRSGINLLPEPQRSQVAQAVRDIENYVAHGLLTAAIEECLRVMEVAPQYLDVHLMLGEIYVRQGKIEQAIAKYAILIDTYMVNGRVDDAISTYRRILQLEPNNLTYRVKLIELLSRQGRIEEALQERMSAADSYLRLGYADRAIQEYEQALLASPNNVQVRLSYAMALMKAGRAPQAVGEYQRILQVDPSNILALGHWQIAQATGVGISPAVSMPGLAMPGGTGTTRVAALEVLARLLRGLRAERMRSYDDIVRLYIQSLESNPTNLDLRYALGMIHLTAGRQQEAVTSFQQAVQGQGLEVLARYGAAQAYLTSGDQGNALNAVRELEAAGAAARQAPVEPTVWAARPRFEGEEHLAPELEISMLLAKAYQASGQVDRMQSTLQAVKQQRPYNDEVYQALAEVSARQGDVQAALQEYAQLVRHYRTNRQVENAITVLKEMARLAPDDPAVRSELADIHVSRGLLDEGVAELRQLADIHMRRGQVKEAALVYQRMAEIDWGMGTRDEALTLLKQAIDYNPDDMGLRQQYVQYCLEVGRKADAAEQQTVLSRYYFASRHTKEAVASLQQLIGMDPRNFEAYDLLGQTYYSVGEYEQAARVYRNLAKVDPTNQMARARLQELQAVRTQMR